jgi:phosphoserine phosphatase
MSEIVCHDLGLDDYVCNRLEVDGDGRYTGRPIEPLCFGAGKVPLAARNAERHGLSLADAVFYTDSLSDVPMLEAVGRPVAVHPESIAASKARRSSGSKLVDWGPGALNERRDGRQESAELPRHGRLRQAIS